MEDIADSCENNPTLKIIQFVNKRYDGPNFGARTTTKWCINSARGMSLSFSNDVPWFELNLTLLSDFTFQQSFFKCLHLLKLMPRGTTTLEVYRYYQGLAYRKELAYMCYCED